MTEGPRAEFEGNGGALQGPGRGPALPAKPKGVSQRSRVGYLGIRRAPADAETESDEDERRDQGRDERRAHAGGYGDNLRELPVQLSPTRSQIGHKGGRPEANSLARFVGIRGVRGRRQAQDGSTLQGAMCGQGWIM